MSPERWQQIKTILDAAAGSPPGGRQEAVEQACSDDSALLKEVESFLELDEEVEDFIEEPLWTLHPAAEAQPKEQSGWVAGRRVGPYRIERPLGRGGMGTVFLARREDAYRQKVAVKVLSWGLTSEEVQARFYNERQILANLQHPGIARLLDGGTTDDGLPYLVMEYVEGERIDRYCENHRLSIRQRLELFREVCAAVHFAHQNLIVHRDLKASNILVNVEGKPRLLDFGIAKLLEPQLAFQTVATVPGRSPMTPAYASPEQVLNDPITTASDVYALGVLLYRLLTGLPPYRLKGTGYAEMVQVICRAEPEKPSTMIQLDEGLLEKETTEAAVPLQTADESAAPDSRGLRGLQRLIAGDLDSIVLKAMRKEPQHRYGSAAEMAEDIRRHLVGLPVEARKGNWVYHTTKFLRRNKLALAAIVVIVAFAVTTTVLWRVAVDERSQAVAAQTKAESEQAKAERAQRRAERVTEYLKGLFKSADPDQSRGDDLGVREVLDAGWRNIADELEEAPDISAEIAGTLSNVYSNLGLYDRAAKLSEKEIQFRRQWNSDDHRELATAINNLGSILYRQEAYRGAALMFGEALAMRRRLGQPDSELVTNVFNLASTQLQLGEYDEAEKFFRQLLEMREHVDSQDNLHEASGPYGLGTIYSYRGDFDQAEPLLRLALEIRIRRLGPEHTRVAEVLNTLGRVLLARGNLDEAEIFYRQALGIRIERLGKDHITVVRTKSGLAALLLARGDIDGAGALIKEVAARISVLEAESASNITVAEARGVWGEYLMAVERFAEAEPILLESYRIIRSLHGSESSFSRKARGRLEDLYERTGKPEQLRFVDE